MKSSSRWSSLSSSERSACSFAGFNRWRRKRNDCIDRHHRRVTEKSYSNGRQRFVSFRIQMSSSTRVSGSTKSSQHIWMFSHLYFPLCPLTQILLFHLIREKRGDFHFKFVESYRSISQPADRRRSIGSLPWLVDHSRWKHHCNHCATSRCWLKLHTSMLSPGWPIKDGSEKLCQIGSTTLSTIASQVKLPRRV